MNMRAARSPGPLSVVIVVSGRLDDLEVLYREYCAGLAPLQRPLDVIVVLDGLFPTVHEQVQRLQQSGEPIRIIQLSRPFGEAAALSAAFRHVRGEEILILPAFRQVAAADLPTVVRGLDDVDMVAARRWPRRDSLFNRLQTRLFALVAGFLTRTTVHDLGCNVRALRRRVAEEVIVYGDQHRFLPILAANQGFRVSEVAVGQSADDARWRIYSPGTCLRRVLDLLTVYFLTKFTRRPMRFYGLTGSATAAAGGLYMAWLVFQRFAMDMPLADRPGLLLATLLVVLGVQIFAMGLIGELIIYANARHMPEFAIEVIIEEGLPQEPPSLTQPSEFRTIAAARGWREL